MKMQYSSKISAYSPYFAILLLFVMICLTGCNQQGSSQWVSDTYVYQNTIPCTDEPESWITMDGLITEREWEDNSWLKYSTSGVTFELTTEFTQSGLYIAGKAEDPYVYHHGDYLFSNNSSFEIYVVREDEETVDNGSRWLYRPGRILRLRIDPKHTVSYTNTPCNTATSVDGTLNTAQESEYHETKGWSFECFVSWESMRLEEKYFAEDGIPNTMKLYVSYQMIDGENANKINTLLEPINTEYFRFDTYWLFGRQGLKGDYSSALLNNAPEGPAATDQLVYGLDDDGDLVVTSHVQRTQMTWAQAPNSENFVIEATFTVAESANAGRTGLGFILYKAPDRSGGYNVFSVNAGDLKNSNILRLQSCHLTDGQQWFTEYSFNEIAATNYESPYGDNSVHLKLVKIGGYMYYFVDHDFYKVEFLDSMKDAVSVGLFLNCPGSVTDYSYEDYSGREQDILATVRDYVYYIDVPGVTTYGTVSAKQAIVPKGEAAVLQIYPGSGYILGDVFNNGVSFLNDLNGTTYTFTPVEDVNVTADFHRLDADKEGCEIVLRIKDSLGESVSGVLYTITDADGKLTYTGKDNGRGVIILTVPKKCAIQTETRLNHFSGNYTMQITKNGYISKTIHIEVGEGNNYEDTLILEQFGYGATTVNGKKTSDAKGTFKFNTEKGQYYSEAKMQSGREVAYHRDYIARSYFASVHLRTAATTGIPNVPGIAITKGDGVSIYLKVSPWAPDQLYIHCGTTNGKDAHVSVSGFNHSHCANGGSASFSVLRKGENVLILDAEGNLAVVLNNLGIHTVGEHAFVDKGLLSGTSTNVSNFFVMENQEHVLGIYNDYNEGSAETYFDVNWSSDPDAIASQIAKIQFVPMNVGTSSEIESIELSGAYDRELGFVSGAVGYMYLRCASEEKAVSSILVQYTDGTSEEFLARYNNFTGKSEVSFVLTKQVTAVSYRFGHVFAVSGKLTAPEHVKLDGTEIVFMDVVSGSRFTTTCAGDGTYEITLFAGSYDVLSENSGFTGCVKNVSVRDRTVVDMEMTKQDYYIGSAIVNNKQINSSSNVTADVTVDSLDGVVTVPYNNSSMMAVLANQIYTGTDDFRYTIKVNGDGMPISPGTGGSLTQIGLGFTDGDNWWVFFVKLGEGNGKSIGAGIWHSGIGGGDFIYHNSLSHNAISENVTNRTLDVDVVLTVEKNAEQLILYAGEGAERVKLLSATTAGYSYSDPNATFGNKAAEAGQMGKIDAFFEGDNEFALCLGSFYYNADITFEIEVD